MTAAPTSNDEDHEHYPIEAERFKQFEKLSGSLFSFLRGTALLVYRDMAGEDSWMPTVLTLGDVHPGNFGVMPSVHGEPVFGVNHELGAFSRIDRVNR